MGRTGKITIVVAPFAFAVLPLAALLMTAGGSSPAGEPAEVRTVQADLPGTMEVAAETAYQVGADCPSEAGGI